MSSMKIKRRKPSKGNRAKHNLGAMLKQSPRTSFPAHMNITLHYSETIGVTNTGSIANDYQFNLNSIYDPNRTGTGHQPLGIDTWAVFYGKYRVDSVDLVVTPLSTTSTTAIILSAVPTDTSTAFTSYYQGREHPYAKSITFQNNGSRPSIRAHYDLYKIAGVSLTKYVSDDLFTATVASGTPSEVMVLHFVTEDANQSTPSTYYNVDLKYNVVFFDPNDQSLN